VRELWCSSDGMGNSIESEVKTDQLSRRKVNKEMVAIVKSRMNTKGTISNSSAVIGTALSSSHCHKYERNKIYKDGRFYQT
jgi:hypothetical protein